MATPPEPEPPEGKTTLKPKPVTLTNWKRVANVPTGICSGSTAQAVHWCDYVVFLCSITTEKKKALYLYHYKWGIWSSLNFKNVCDINEGSCPLAVFNDNLILFSEKGDIFRFFKETGSWKVFESLQIKDDLLIDPGQNCYRQSPM